MTSQTTAEPMSTARLIVLHLLPGALAIVLFVLIAEPIQNAGFPPVLAFLIAIVVVIVPFEMGTIILAGRTDTAQGGILSALRFREPMSRRDWLTLWPALAVVAIVGFGLLSLLDNPIKDALFGWLPSWYQNLIDTNALSDYSASAWILTLVLYAALNVFIGPIVEELYFRGYLLPRMSAMGRWAPLVNAVLFSLYHFWAPWAFLSRVAGVTPFAYAVERKRSFRLGMAVHVTLNAIGTASLAAYILGNLP
jgi:membrane protease YdiL (CAAX protease family)